MMGRLIGDVYYPFIGYSNIWGGSGIRYVFAYFWDITWYYMILQWLEMETYHLSAMIFWIIFGWRHSTISRRSCFAWLTNFIASCTHLSRRGAMAAAWAWPKASRSESIWFRYRKWSKLYDVTQSLKAIKLLDLHLLLPLVKTLRLTLFQVAKPPNPIKPIPCTSDIFTSIYPWQIIIHRPVM